jgi:hypothetical protein
MTQPSLDVLACTFAGGVAAYSSGIAHDALMLGTDPFKAFSKVGVVSTMAFVASLGNSARVVAPFLRKAGLGAYGPSCLAFAQGMVTDAVGQAGQTLVTRLMTGACPSRNAYLAALVPLAISGGVRNVAMGAASRHVMALTGQKELTLRQTAATAVVGGVACGLTRAAFGVYRGQSLNAAAYTVARTTATIVCNISAQKLMTQALASKSCLRAPASAPAPVQKEQANRKAAKRSLRA